MENRTADNGTDAAREKLWSGTFVLVIAATFFCFVVGQGLNSSTSVYVALYGGTATYAGVLAAAFSAAAAATRLAAGPLIDERGRRIVAAGGFFVLIVGTAGPLFTHEVVPFTIFRILQGVGFSAATTALGTAAADVVPTSRMGEGIGYAGLGQALAMSVGPAFALMLASSDPAENLFWGLCAIGVCGLALVAACRYEKRPEVLPATASYRRRREREGAVRGGAADRGEAADAASAAGRTRDTLVSRVFEKHALVGAVPLLVMCPAFGFAIFFAGLYGTSLGVASPGAFFTASAVSMIVVRIGGATFMDRVAPIRLFTTAAICGILAFATLLACGSGALGQEAVRDGAFYGAGFLYGACIGIAMPVNQSIAVKNTPPERWGAANALIQLANDVGIGTSCIVWGIVNDTLGFGATICCVMCCIAASVLVARAMYPASGTPARSR